MKLEVCTDITPVSRESHCGKLLLGEEGTQHLTMGHVVLEKRGNQLFVDDRKVVRFPLTSPEGPWNIRGHEIRKVMVFRPTLNTCFADTLLENPEFIPDEWNDGRTYFGATIYLNRYPQDPPPPDLCVRYLYRNVAGLWVWSYTPLDYCFGPKAYAAELRD